jgi:creatinine amidohydrolase/Fe(II)-dependent formamide hydrolase-like protein
MRSSNQQSVISNQRLLAVALIVATPAIGGAQVLKVAELNTEQIRGLDRARTAVILIGGILEEHGPYLPSYTDGYWNERMGRDLAETIAARPGWTALMFPPIPLGHGGANMIGGKPVFPGSFNVRAETLRAVYMDLADALGDLGFRWILVVDDHGAPPHNDALDQAGDYFHDVHGGRMVHLYGLQEMRECCGETKRRLLSEAALKEDGFTVHAGASEHSSILFLRPDLVPAAIASAPPVTGTSFEDLVRLAAAPGWTGYFGSPRLASAALGAQSYASHKEFLVGLALRVLDGWDPSREPRYATVIEAITPVRDLLAARKAEEQRQQRQREWLEKRKH